MTDIKTIAAGALLVLLLACGGVAKYLYGEVQELNGTVAQLEEKNKELAGIAERNAQAVRDIEKERDALIDAASARKVQDAKDDKRWNTLNNRLLEAMKNAEVREWYTAYVPVDVDRMLDDEGAVRAASGSQEGVPGSVPDQSNAGAGVGKEGVASN